MLNVKQLPVLNDNYVYLIIDEITQTTACVDLTYLGTCDRNFRR